MAYPQTTDLTYWPLTNEAMNDARKIGQNIGDMVDFLKDGTKDLWVGDVQGSDFIKTGWPDSPGVTLSFDDATRVFTVTDGGSAYYYINGQKYTLGGDKTVGITDTEGVWYIYFSGDTLTASQTSWNILDDNKAMVAWLYWDATNSKKLWVGYELHGYVMDAATHYRMHRCNGAAWDTGLAVTDAGSEQVNVSAGDIHDEDIEISITNGSSGGTFEQVLIPLEAPISYLSGATPVWRKWEVTDKVNATDIGYVDGSNDVHYNYLNAGSWSSAAVPAGQYVAMWVLGTDTQSEPIELLMGQRVDTTLANAKLNNTAGGLVLTGLPYQEMIFLARLILKKAAGAPFYTLEEVVDLRSTNNAGSVVSPIVYSHSALTGLTNTDHPFSALYSTAAARLCGTTTGTTAEEIALASTAGLSVDLSVANTLTIGKTTDNVQLASVGAGVSPSYPFHGIKSAAGTVFYGSVSGNQHNLQLALLNHATVGYDVGYGLQTASGFSSAMYLDDTNGNWILYEYNGGTPLVTVTTAGAGTFASTVTATGATITAAAGSAATIAINADAGGAAGDKWAIVAANAAGAVGTLDFKNNNGGTTYLSIDPLSTTSVNTSLTLKTTEGLLIGDGKTIGTTTTAGAITLAAAGAATFSSTVQATQGGFGRAPSAGYMVDAYSSASDAKILCYTDATNKFAQISANADGNCYVDTYCFADAHSAGTYFGVSRIGSVFTWSTGAPYFGIGTSDATTLILGTNNTAALTISSAQAATFSSTCRATQFGAGTAPSYPFHTTLSATGTAYYVSSSGNQHNIQMYKAVNVTAGYDAGYGYLTNSYDVATYLDDTNGAWIVYENNGGAPMMAVPNAGITANTTGSAANVYVDANNLLYKGSSSKRYKKNIRVLRDSERIYDLRPVSFCMKRTPELRQIGFIAEEVAEVMPEMVDYDKQGRPDGVHYAMLVSPLIAEMKKIRKENADMRKEIELLKSPRGKE